MFVSSAELLSEINSEHCRHTHFGSEHEIDGVVKTDTLFGLIKSTHAKSPEYTVSAYSDNGAIFQGLRGSHFSPNSNGEWTHVSEEVQTILKVVCPHSWHIRTVTEY